MASKYQISLGIDLDDVLRDSKAALDQLEKQYRKTLRKIQKDPTGASGTAVGARRAYTREVRKVTTPPAGRTLTAAEQAKADRFSRRASQRATRVRDEVFQGVDPKLAAGMNKAAARRLKALQKSVKKEEDLAKHADVLADKTAEAAVLARRRVNLERQVLNRARLSTQGQADMRVVGRNKADEELLKARERDATRKAGRGYEDELAGLSAQERLTKERRLRKEREAYNAVRSRADMEDEARDVIARERGVLQRRLLVAAKILGHNVTQQELEEDITRLKARTRNAEKQVANSTAAAQRRLDTGGTGQKTSMFQRLQAMGGGDPNEKQRLGAFMKQRAISSAGFAISGLGIYGAINAIRELITESSELQVQFDLIESQFNMLGGEDLQGPINSFEKLREGILDVARETASAADETASITRQLAGAFAEDGIQDFNRALLETQDALKVARVTGLPNQEITDSLTAISLAFESQGITFEQVGDLMVGLEAQYGVLGTQLVQFTADLAPLGAELGFTAEQLTALGAVAQRTSGRSGTVIAEQLGRILPALQDQRTAVLELFQANVNTAGSVGYLAQAFSEGDIPGVVSLLAGNFDKFSESQRNALASMVGGRREASVLFSILTDGQDTVKALNDTDFSDFAGDLEDRFESVKDGVKFNLDELQRSFEEFGILLFEAGLADAIIAIANAFKFFFDALSPLLELVASFNTALGGLPIQLLAVAAGLKGLRALSGREGMLGTMLTGAGRPGRYARRTPLSVMAYDGMGALGRGAGQTGRALFGGGTMFGKGIPKATGLAGTLRGLAPALLAFEGLNMFFDNVNKEAAKTAALAEETSQTLTQARERGPTAIASAREDIEDQIAKARAEAQEAGFLGRKKGNVFADGRQNIVARGVNFLGGATLRAFGSDSGDAALRSAAGQPQDFEILEQQLAADKSKDYQEILNRVFEYNETEFIRALRGASTKVLADVVNANKDYKTEAVKDFIGDDNQITDKDLTKKNIQKLLEAALAGDELATELIRLISDFAGSEGNSDILSEANTVAALEGPGGEVPQMDQIKEQLERGEITTATFVEKARAIGDSWRKAALATKKGSEVTQENLDKAAEAYADAAAAANELFQEDIDVENFVASLGFTADDPTARAERVRDQLNSARARGVSNEDLGGLARELIEAERDAFQARIDSTEDISEKLRLAEGGFEFSRDARAAIGLVRLTSGTAQESVEAIANQLGMTTDEITDLVVEGFKQHGRSAAETLMHIAREKAEMERARALALAVAKGAFNIAKAEGVPLAIAEQASEENKGAASGEVEKINEAYDAAIKAADDHLAALEGIFELPTGTAGSGTSPAELEKLRKQKEEEDKRALEELARAAEEARQKALEEELSLLDVATARAGGDAVELARIARRRAQTNQRYADTASERNAALAELINADRELASAMFDLFSSSADVTIAQAEAAGNSVGAAQERLRVLQEQMRRAGELGLGPAERNRLSAEIIGQQAAVRDAALAEEREMISYQLEIGEITQGQAVAALQSLLTIPTLAEDQIRELNLEIKRMTDSLGADFQFNLPTQLALPTAYEVRRFGDSGGSMAGGYNDNRTISLEINVATNANPDEIATAVTNALGDPSRTGTQPRRY